MQLVPLLLMLLLLLLFFFAVSCLQQALPFALQLASHWEGCAHVLPVESSCIGNVDFKHKCDSKADILIMFLLI